MPLWAWVAVGVVVFGLVVLGLVRRVSRDKEAVLAELLDLGLDLHSVRPVHVIGTWGGVHVDARQLVGTGPRSRELLTRVRAHTGLPLPHTVLTSSDRELSTSADLRGLTPTRVAGLTTMHRVHVRDLHGQALWEALMGHPAVVELLALPEWARLREISVGDGGVAILLEGAPEDVGARNLRIALDAAVAVIRTAA